LFRRLNPTRSRRRHSKCSRRCTRNIGSGIGISLVIFLLTRNTQIVHAERAGHVTPSTTHWAPFAPSHFWNMATTLGRADTQCRGHQAGERRGLHQRLQADGVYAGGAAADLAAEARQGAAGEAAILE